MKKIVFLMLLLSAMAFGQDGKFDQLSFKCKDNQERPFILYSPKSLKGNEKKPLLIFLHGSVSNPELKKDPLKYMKASKMIQLSERGGFYLMFVYGQKGAAWFDSVGIDMINGEIDEAKKKFDIDENKVFLSGFSDGGSGVLYFSMVNPAPFAGFISMNGSLKVADKLGENEPFPANSNNRPLYIINTKEDALYPINQITPAIDYLKEFNANIIYKELEGNHEMSYLKTEQEHLLSFIKTTSSKPLDTVSWESSEGSNKNLKWISITKVDSLSVPKKWHNTYNLKVFNDKADFGLDYDYSYDGKGLKVKGFRNDTVTAKKMGIEKNDIVIIMEKDSITSAYSPYYYTAKKKAGDNTSVTVTRNDKTMVLSGKFNPGFCYEIFKHKSPSGKLKAIINDGEISIETSKISEISIDFNQLTGYNIRKIKINGEKIKSDFKGIQIIKI